MRPLVTSSMIASILPKSSPLELTTVSPISVAASMISGPGPSERQRSAPIIGAPPAAWADPVVEYELMGVVISGLLAERCFGSACRTKASTVQTSAEPRLLEYLRLPPSPDVRHRRAVPKGRAALTRGIAILLCAAARVN